MGEEQRVTGHQVRLDGLGVQLALGRVRGQHHDQVGLLAGLVRGEHPQALRLGLGPAAAALGQADAYVDPGVAQRQGVGVTLAAEAQDGDVSALDHRQVGVGVVEHLSWHWWFSLVLVERVRVRAMLPGEVAAASSAASGLDGRLLSRSPRWVRSVIERLPRPRATRPDWTSSRMPYGSNRSSSASSLAGTADGLDCDHLRGQVDRLGAEQLDDLEQLATGLAVARP